MSDYEYIIIGGGTAGLGAFDALLSAGYKNIALFEARDSLMYTNTWMKNIEVSDTKEDKYFTGSLFREELIKKQELDKKKDKIFTDKRVYNIDQKEKRIHIRTASGEREEYTYNNLIVAVGAAQIMYGKYLLPGTRGGRFFTCYQVGEMIEHYPFKPGNNLIVFGESMYTLETAILAYKSGISVKVISPGKLELPENWPTEIKVFDEVILKQVYGDTLFEGMMIQSGSGENCIFGDSLAVDGAFILEHPWREHLGVEWDLKNWKLDLSLEEMKKRNLIVVGDAYNPDPNFFKQYNSSFEIINKLTKEGEI